MHSEHLDSESTVCKGSMARCMLTVNSDAVAWLGCRARRPLLCILLVFLFLLCSLVTLRFLPHNFLFPFASLRSPSIFWRNLATSSHTQSRIHLPLEILTFSDSLIIGLSHDAKGLHGVNQHHTQACTRFVTPKLLCFKAISRLEQLNKTHRV